MGSLCAVDGCGEDRIPGRSLCSAHGRLRGIADELGLPLKTAVLAVQGDDRVAPWVKRALDTEPRRSRLQRRSGRAR